VDGFWVESGSGPFDSGCEPPKGSGEERFGGTLFGDGVGLLGYGLRELTPLAPFSEVEEPGVGGGIMGACAALDGAPGAASWGGGSGDKGCLAPAAAGAVSGKSGEGLDESSPVPWSLLGPACSADGADGS
jgi:hypothetical protein